MTEKIIPDGYKLAAVKGLDELVYWLDRCKYKRHLENCPDLIEPFEAFEYRNVSEEAVIAAHEAKAEPAVPQCAPVAWFEYNESLDAWFLAYSRNPNAKTRPLVFGDVSATTAAPSQPVVYQYETSAGKTTVVTNTRAAIAALREK